MAGQEKQAIVAALSTEDKRRFFAIAALGVLGSAAAAYEYGIRMAAAFVLICACFYVNGALLQALSDRQKASRRKKVSFALVVAVCNVGLALLVDADPLILVIAWLPGIAAVIAARV